jgi:hypothetical protein
MNAEQRVAASRGEQPDDLAANGDGCDRISLSVSLMKRKITPDAPGIRGMSVNMKLIALLTALFLVGGAAQAKKIRGHTPSVAGVVQPQGAKDGGFNTLAFNADFSKGPPDIGCHDEPGHQWYVHKNGVHETDCSRIIWPYTDPVTGETTARFNWNQMNQPSSGLVNERVGLSSSNNDGSYFTQFPIDGYYECRMRVQPYRFAGGWWNCWMNATNPDINYNNAGFEYDIYEAHSGWAENNNFYTGIAGIQDWWNGGGGESPTFLTNAGPAYDPSSKMHTWGMLIQTNQTVTPPLIRTRAYWDNALVGDTGWYDPHNPTTGAWYKQWNFITWDVTAGCSFQTSGNLGGEGYADCVNQPIANVVNDGGFVQIVMDGANAPTGGVPLFGYDIVNLEINITGVRGTTNANGHWTWAGAPGTDINTCQHNCAFNIYDVSTRARPAFNAPYSGGGVWNPTPNGIDLIASHFQVWTCSDWRTSNHCAIGVGN